ncbi:MAG: aminotransferase class V-fold PLP-dependent enzyme [Clostridia bacterium]|nr:aminotransferase class V-fold PLP-dependent enzyme [Clostridia bacterium]
MIYLDNAATTFPKPLCLTDEINHCLKSYCGNPGRSAHSLAIKSAEKVYEARELIAELFNSESQNVVFTYNTTYALNIAIKSLLIPHSHVLISDIEHNSVYRPIYKLSQDGLCSFDIFSTNGTDEDIIRNIQSLIKPSTKMLVCNHASNIGVRRLPILKIGKLCEKNDIIFIIDGAQSAGIYDIDIKSMRIDALCVPAHKGLYGPQGIGIIVFNEIQGKGIIEGGTGINSLDPLMPDFLPEAYEAGTLSTPLIAGLCESLKWLKSLSLRDIRSFEEELYDICIENLMDDKNVNLYLMNNYKGNTILFNINGVSSHFVASELNKSGICVRSGFHCSPLAHKTLNTGESGAVRISLSVFNTKKDIYTACNAIKGIINKKIRH